MKKSYLKLNVYLLFFSLFFLFNTFVYKFLNQISIIVILLVMLVILKYLLGFEKDRHRYIKDVILEIIINLIVFFIIYYLMGIFTSYARTNNYYTLRNIFGVTLSSNTFWGNYRGRGRKMNFLEERIVKDGIVKEGNVLKVDSFLNHQMDIKLLNQMGAEFKKRFADKNINKILTIEASGIGIACIVAEHFDVPVVFAKKSQSINLDGEMYVAEVESFTHKCKNNVIVSQKFLSEDDHVLIIDDFLANGCALQGLIQIVQSSGATVEGIGIAIEKGFQSGGRIIRNLGFQLESLAIVDGMDASTGQIFFREQNAEN